MMVWCVKLLPIAEDELMAIPADMRARFLHIAPVGHFKLPHFWPVKFPQAGQSDYQSSVLLRARRAAASLSR